MRTDERLDGEVAGAGDLPTASRSKVASRERYDLNTLHASSLEILRSQWASVYGIEPLPRLSRELLVRGIAYRTQERELGGLSRSTLRKLERIVRGEQKRAGSKTSWSTHPGTRLVREWQGRVHEVVVLDDGFLWNGAKHGSLSEIARLITGTRWSGPRFFGMQDGAGGKAR